MTQDHNKDLKNFVDNVCESSHLRVESDLGDGYFRLRASEAQRRQAKQDIRCNEDIVIEMLRNSRDAKAKNIFLACNTENANRNILVIDDGVGIPKSHHKLVFEPYVTSKLDTMTTDIWGVHGRGMALYSIYSNATKAYVVNSNSGIGSSIKAETDINKLGEKKDQSSFPNFYVNQDNELVVRGPKNILRKCAEFAIENRNKVNIYVGSPVEIAATMYHLSKQKADVKAIFHEPNDQTMLVDLLSYSSDVHDFKKFAMSLGIYLSKRTARRIMDGDITAQKSVLARIIDQGISKSDITTNNSLSRKSQSSDVFDIFSIKAIHKAKPTKKNIKIENADKEELAKALIDKFSTIADKYYLDKNINPNVKLKNNKINISFDISEIE